MTDRLALADELLSLSEAVRDHVATLASQGWAEVLLDDGGLPVPDGSSSAEGLGASPNDDASAPEDAAEVAEDPWGALAAQDRAARVPSHHVDAAGSAGLDAIRADLGDCRRCGLCEGRTRLVFGVGDPDADLMVIGEGPGEQEDRTGEPFVGPAGQMLDRMLENVIGLTRSQVYIANVVKCRPPGNRKPDDAEARTCLPFLVRQIRAIRPKVILVLGGTALEHLCGTTGITKQRGRERLVEGIPTIPTFHPAYLLRRAEDKRLTFADLKQVKARYDALGGRRA